MEPTHIRFEPNEVHAVFIEAAGYPMPGETFTYDAHTYTVHMVTRALHSTYGSVIIATATREDQ